MKTYKKVAFGSIIGVIALIIVIIALCRNCVSDKIDMVESVNYNTIVVLETTMGKMKIELYNDTPQHRDNFLKLMSSGFYDGLRFHRVIPGFMIQTGDPYSRADSLKDRWGTGGPGYTIPAEIRHYLRHKKGAVAAARMGDMANPRRASSGSQFYIVHDPEGCVHLNSQYTIFGEVMTGLDVLDAIANVPTDEYDRPIKPVTILKVYSEHITSSIDMAASSKATDAAAADTTTTAAAAKGDDAAVAGAIGNAAGRAAAAKDAAGKTASDGTAAAKGTAGKTAAKGVDGTKNK